MSASALFCPRSSFSGEIPPLKSPQRESHEDDSRSDTCTESSVRSEPQLVDVAGVLLPAAIPRLPEYAIPLQPKLLKQINTMHTKEELLAFVASCHLLLDPINLVTCVYRLARLYTAIRHPEQRQAWKVELSESPSFQVLLRTVQAHMLAAQMHPMYSQEVKGIDARCVSNLIWALVKLDLASEVGCAGNDVILSISPLVLRLLGQSSPQGLANLLWAYAKLAEPPLEVISAIMNQMTDMLSRDQSGSLFDAQALSNSIWAVAHARSKLPNFDGQCGPPGAVCAFLVSIAVSANTMLKALYTRLDLAHLSAFLNAVEHKFSCQALVNIVWSFATILGEECAAHPVIKQLFVNSRKEAIVRLRATYAALQTQQSWVYHMPGGFNEQALSNVVYAYEKAGMLDRELLQWVFSVAALRLDRRDAPPSFKPQELCTLLRAAHLDICEPQPFLAKLARIVQTMPWIVRNWSTSELNELSRALGLLQPSLMMQQQQQQAQQQQVQQAKAQQQQQHAAAAALLGLSGPGLEALLVQANMLAGLNGGNSTALAVELLAAELQQVALQNALAQQLGAAAGMQPGGGNGACGGVQFGGVPPNSAYAQGMQLSMSPPDARHMQAMHAMHMGAGMRPAVGVGMMQQAPTSW